MLLGWSRKESTMPRRAFFFWFASIARHLSGVLNPASGKSMIETCIPPVLLYRNWLLKEGLINQLNSFLGEWANQCPKHHSNTATRGTEFEVN